MSQPPRASSNTAASRQALAREVRRLAIPAILNSLLQTMVFVVDRAMLGHHAETSLAGMQVAGPIEWSLWSVFMAFEVGTIARVGRHVGAKDPERTRRAAILSLGIAVAAGLFVALASPAVTPFLGRMFPSASPAAVDAARSYLVWTLSASPVVFVTTTAIATLTAGGDARTPLAIGIGTNVFHIALNRVLILGALGVPAMGMAGAGISTTVSFTLEALLTVAALFRRGRPVSLRRAQGAVRGGRAAYLGEARALQRIANPAVLERILYHLGYLGYVAVLGLLGDAPMAANQSLISVESICFLSADGFGLAAAALVAQKLGAGLPGEATRAAKISARYAIVLLTTVGVVFLALRAVILPLFSNDPEVVAIGAAAVPVLAFAQPFMATSTVLAQSLRGAGMTRPVLAVSAVCAFGVRIACTWLFAITFGMGLTGVWVGSTCDWVVRSVLLVWLGRVKAREATRAAPSPS
jgi:MATE family multidrug resistance protein